MVRVLRLRVTVRLGLSNLRTIDQNHPRLPGLVGTRRINHSGFCLSRDDRVAVASATRHASHLHFAPYR